jgi:hypothetical protein
MSRTNRNFIIAYIFLVVLPAIGLVGVLRAGRNISPPRSVDGTWTIQTDFDPLSSSGCLKSLGPIRQTDFIISQSGKSLTITFGDEGKGTGSGTIEGNRFVASIQSPKASADAECGNDGTLALDAALEQKAAPQFFEGSLSARGCPSCTPLQFRAVRLEPDGSKRTH